MVSPRYLKSVTFMRDSLLHMVLLRWENHQFHQILKEMKEFLP